MTLLQTVKVPENRRVYFEVPREIPTGSTAQFEVIWFPKPKKKESNTDTVLNRIWALCKDEPGGTVDEFLEERRKDMEMEERKLFGECSQDCSQNCVAESTPEYGGSN